MPFAGCLSFTVLLQRHFSSENEGASKVDKVQNQVDELKGIMVRNIGEDSKDIWEMLPMVQSHISPSYTESGTTYTCIRAVVMLYVE